ncbi:hypothetical protein WOLCODRAFT_135615 [Wolfiporia cocos MD-104 SS10]|uniref:Uncharacterized protein n=1 Tax=Wolfiporia cocos (strain MD-104) TaxID=742152 RepID=A0A2H3IWD5_WOLCO|nr:hypothetical protein WOLCODRAFT_135615 [Wolfiporia cocos MD-104 SS10]
MTIQPRPILKRDSPPPPLSDDLPFSMCDHILSPRVHFPPTPCMSSMKFTHSSQAYDRAPIVVSPNNGCLIPKRDRRLRSPLVHPKGARGRMHPSEDEHDYESDDEEVEEVEVVEEVKGSYFHPRAYEACTLEPVDTATGSFDVSPPPSLVPDLSPSDESDDPVRTPPDPLASAQEPKHFPPRFTAFAELYPLANESSIDSRCLSPRSSSQSTQTMTRRKTRPSLVRSEKAYRSLAASSDLDEGCLGGF